MSPRRRGSSDTDLGYSSLQAVQEAVEWLIHNEDLLPVEEFAGAKGDALPDLKSTREKARKMPVKTSSMR